MSAFVDRNRRSRNRTTTQSTMSSSFSFLNGGFQNLEGFVHPYDRSFICDATVGALIRRHFADLELFVEWYKKEYPDKRDDDGKLHVYLPWSTDSEEWGFAIFEPSEEVKNLITELAIDFFNKYDSSDNDDVVVHKNKYDHSVDVGNSKRDYKLLVENKYNIMVFGDNTRREGIGGTACVRGKTNTFGIPTGWKNAIPWRPEQEASFYKRRHTEYAVRHTFGDRMYKSSPPSKKRLFPGSKPSAFKRSKTSDPASVGI